MDKFSGSSAGEGKHCLWQDGAGLGVGVVLLSEKSLPTGLRVLVLLLTGEGTATLRGLVADDIVEEAAALMLWDEEEEGVGAQDTVGE